MRIELARLDESDGKFAHDYVPGELAVDDVRVHLDAPMRVSGRVAQSRGKVVVAGKLETRVNVDCDRCLRYVDLPVQTEFSLEYVTTEAYEATSAAELTDEDLELSVFDGESIDVDELVREQLLLTLPTRVLCEETCKGLCPICGADRNTAECDCAANDIDPRWQALTELANGKS
jgi:uncharacterized protein